MMYSVALLAAATAVMASPMPQGVTDTLTPDMSAPEGCMDSVDGSFNIQIVNVSSMPMKKRQDSGTLSLTLEGGVLKDQAGRTGYIAANDQFQFDDPPQTGAMYTAGFSLCANNSLALGGSAIWWQCLSGEFYNLYSMKQGNQCNEVYYEAINGGMAQSGVSQMADGQPAATTAVSQIADGQPQGVPVTQIADGQPQASTGAAVTQIADGQVQAATTGAAVSQIADGQVQAATTGAAVSQIADGQVQAATTGAAVSQIADGQVQAATTGAAVSQIADGQVQAATTGAAVSQIADGQVQAATTGAPVSQIADGQVQAYTTGAPVSQIADGQVQAYTGAATKATAGMMMAGLVVVAALL